MASKVGTELMRQAGDEIPKAEPHYLDETLNRLERELFAAHWVKSPNNIHSLPGSLWYASGPNIKAMPTDLEALVQRDRIRIFRMKFFGEPYTRRSFWDTITVEVFDNVTDFLAWVEKNGIYNSALPAGANVWD
jgi:hypothetical protein